jgi:hypothetical protein
MKRLTYLATLGTLLLVSLTLLVAQTARAQEEQEQEPDTGVARVSMIRGDVTVTRGDSGDQVATSVNSPLGQGDKIVTGENSQAEIQLDHSNIIRLAPSSEIRIADLTRSVIQIQVAQGLVNYTVFKTNEAQIEIDSPNMAVRPIKEGSYRIQVTSPEETLLIVRKGDADVTTPEGTTRVEEGRLITVRGAQSPEYQIANAPGRDDWDKWNKDRDDAVNNAKSYKYANRYYTGAQDLDSHGRWDYMPDSGDYAWTPNVGAGWTPYHDGYWGWQPYWGWTWISYEPWGWAPYHYGRWSYYGSSWYWYPGSHSYGYRPMWGPAWVSFIGFGFGGRNWNFGFGYGYNSIGWCPLGRYDSYHPWWGRHNSYTAMNITNMTNFNRGGRGGDQFGRGGYQSNLQSALTNANVRGGITRVSAEDFGRGNFSRAQRGLDANTLREGQLVQGRIPVAPTRETLRPVAGNSGIGRTSGAETFFSRRQAPAVNRTFNDQAASVQNMMRNNPFDAAGSRSGAANTTGGTAAAGRSSGNTGAAGSSFGGRAGTSPGRGLESSGAVNSQAESRGSAVTRGAGQPGWSRFGQPRVGGGQTSGGVAPSQGAAAMTQRNSQGSQPSGQQGQAAPQQGRSWQRFGTGQPRAVPNRPTTTGTQQSGQPAPGGSGFANTNRQSQGASGRATPAPRVEGGYTPPQRGGSGAAPSSGWQRFGSRSGNSGVERPALDIRKPITMERAAPRTFERGLTSGSPAGSTGRAPAAPRSFEGGGRAAPRSFGSGGSTPSGSQGSAPSSAPRSFQGSGRAAPSSSPRSFERSGASAGYGGGSRGWSAPSGGGAARSAPSGGYGGGGGNRGWSAPSGGGGGGRGASAPSGGGGGRSTSAPSGGGGRSAPSSSRGGGHSGRR